jgi:hypothetical protein
VLHRIRLLIVYASPNPFTDVFAVQRISSLTSLCFANQFPNKSVLQHISWLTSLCFSESVRWRVCASLNPFANEVEVQRSSSLMSLCHQFCWQTSVIAIQMADKAVLQRLSSLTILAQRISSLTSLRCSESVRWVVFASANKFVNKYVL